MAAGLVSTNTRKAAPLRFGCEPAVPHHLGHQKAAADERQRLKRQANRPAGGVELAERFTERRA